MIECSVKIILRQKVYPSPRGQISVPHRREVKASGVQSKWLGEQRMRVCTFGSLLRLSKRVYFLFIYVYVYVLNSWRPEMDIESPAAGGTGTCELPHLGAGSRPSVLCKIDQQGALTHTVLLMSGSREFIRDHCIVTDSFGKVGRNC